MIKRYHFLHSSDDPIADEANIGVADKVGGSFVVNSAFASLFSEVNTDALEYAPSISSDQLELFFTRAYKKIDGSFEFNIYMASRNNTSEPWNQVRQLENAIGEISEAPSISTGGNLLYYHQKVSAVFKIYVLERAQCLRITAEKIIAIAQQ